MTRPARQQQAATIWRRRLERFEESGLSVARFCEEEGCSPASFYQWRKRLAEDDRGEAGDEDSRPGFQQITVTVGRPLTIELTSGARIEVPPENLEAVRTVVSEVVRAERSVEEGTVRC